MKIHEVEPRSAQYFIQELTKIKASVDSNYATSHDLFNNEFTQLMRIGLQEKLWHPGVSNALSLFFCFKDEAKNNFFIEVLKTAAFRYSEQHESKEREMLESLTKSLSKSNLRDMSSVASSSKKLDPTPAYRIRRWTGQVRRA